MTSAIVIGAGPAGLIAAETLAAGGCDVTVYDHARSAGRKFLLAGRGGLNITHSESIDRFAERYDAPEWMRPMLDAFTPDDLRSWCLGLGEATFVGSSGRVFPESFRATPLLRAWLRRLDELGVRFEMQHRWLGWGDGGHRFDHDGAVTTVDADVTVLALGGASWPRVGSDGGWVSTFAAAGIEVASLQPSNAGAHIAWSDHFRERFEGVPIKNVAVAAGDRAAVRGDVVVTRTGFEGGPIYAVNPELRAGGQLVIDLHPDQSVEQLMARLVRRRPKDSESNWLRRATGLSAAHLGLVREVGGGSVPDGAAAVAQRIKQLTVKVAGLAPIDRAISTAGGVSRDELDDGLMVRKQPGTYVAGEMIDWDAPTGGYLLQASFSTGIHAARAALSRIAR